MAEQNTDNLSARAARTAGNKFALQATRMVVGLVATPFIVAGVGMQHYGAWLVLQQWVSYLSLLDFQAMGTLKFKLALEQHNPDEDKRRRLVGAAIKLWLYLLPLWVIVSCALVYFAPSIIRLEPEQIGSLQIAFAISAFTVVAGRLLSIPANVLRGMNEDFRVTIPSAITIAIGGALNVFAVVLGFGLAGLAASVFLTLVLISAIELVAVRRYCPWFGVRKPAPEELRSFTSLSGSVFTNNGLLLLLLSSDLTLAAYLFSPTDAAILGATGAALRMMAEPFQQLLAASNSGLLGLAGKGEWERVALLRAEQRRIAFALIAVIGSGTVLLNQPFLALWLGPSFFGGLPLTITLVALALLTTLIKVDAVFLLAMKRVSAGSWYAAAALVVSLSTATIGAATYGLPGMMLGFVLGRLVLYLGQSFLIEGFFRGLEIKTTPSTARAAIAGILLTGLSSYLAPRVAQCSLPEFLLYGVLCVAVCSSAVFYLAFSKVDRLAVRQRIRRVFVKKTPNPPQEATGV